MSADNLTLFLIRDADEPEMWIDRWAVSYPVVQTVSCQAGESLTLWQQRLAAAWADTQGRAMMVAHGSGVGALMAWQYQSSLIDQQRLAAMMLVAPRLDACPNDDMHTLLRARINCRAALVIGQNDPLCPTEWAAEWAQRWGARLLTAPQSGHLNRHLGGWQWGMKLMQEMLLH